MKLLTLKIDNSKYHFVNFDQEDYSKQQYIFNNLGTQRNIIRFFPFNNDIRNGITFQTNEGKSQCYISEIKLSENTSIERFDGESLCVNILLSEKRPPKGFAINDDRLKLNNDGKLILKTGINSAIISVDINYEETSRQFTLIYAKRKKVADAVLDYGSEASQLLVANRDNDIIIDDILNLFTEVKDVNIAGQGLFRGVENSDFAQYSENNEKLFLSKFMIKKKINGNLLNVEQHLEVKSSDVFKFIFQNSEIDKLSTDYTILPNTKIRNFGIGNIEIRITEDDNEDGHPTLLHQLRDDICHRMSVNIFLFQALEQVRQNNLGNNVVEFVSFSVLMPNNYSYKEISNKLKYLRIDIQQIIDTFKNKFDFIKGFEVSAVSESDASLIGASEISTQRIGNEYRFKDGNYLILDAGKGTLDFSIMKYNRADHICYQNLCKSGIIGAGNAISYAILLDVLDGIIVIEGDHETHLKNIQTFINDIILGNSDTGRTNGGGDPSNLLKLMNVIEAYKKGDRTTVREHATRIAAKELNISGVINIINSEFVSKRQCLAEHRFTNIIINKIVDSIFSQIEKVNIGNEIDYYVFAGRGFLYRPLKDAVVSKIIEKFPNCNGEITYIGNNNNATPKNVCLFISNKIKNGNYNTNIIGIPFIINDPIPETRDKKDDETPTSHNNFFRHLCQEFKNLLSKDEVVTVEDTLMPTNRYHNYNSGNIADDPMVNGYHFNNKSNSVSRINIGGLEFGLERTIPKNTNIDVFYDGNEYIVRSNGSIYGIDTRVNVEGQLTFESLFPSVNSYPQEYNPFFTVEDFNEEDQGILDSVAIHLPQGSSFNADDNNDTNNTPSEMDILLEEIDNQKK